jgi:hypothetical protein
LPASKSVIDEVLTLPDWTDHIKDITPDTTRSEVRKMKAALKHDPQPAKKKPAKRKDGDLASIIKDAENLSYAQLEELHDAILQWGMEGHRNGNKAAYELVEHCCRTSRAASAEANGGVINITFGGK